MSDPDFFQLRALMAAHRTDRAGPTRVGSIIENHRKSMTLVDDTLPDGTGPSDMDAAVFQTLRQRVAEVAPSVGVIEIDDNGWKAIGTCFRVSADKRRVATARHMLRAVLSPGGHLRCAPDEVARAIPPTPPYRNARVRFEATQNHPEEVVPIASIEWPHDRWDMMLLRLGGDCARPAVRLAAADPPGAAVDEDICVIGYPQAAPAQEASDSFAEVFTGPLGHKRASPGKLRRRVPIDPQVARPGEDVTILRHDASTLGGNSGSPVVLVATGEVIGIHYFGGSGRDDPNRAVYLPAALIEPALRARMLDGAVAVGEAPLVWPPNGPLRRFGQALTFLRADGEELAHEAAALPQAVGVVPDRFDIRDRFYSPPLVPAKDAILPDPLDPAEIGCQYDPFSCTGFALAAAINRQLQARDSRTPRERVSPAMLYALATQHDEFVDDRPGGSSLRGAIKGFFHGGACLEATAPYVGHDPGWHLTIAAAKEARNITLGAYYRLRPVLSDYQLAVQQAGSVVVSAHLHPGWERGQAPIQRIRLKPGRRGAHAFAIVGYDETGFIIQNSWGADWSVWKGRKGHAHWSYADWAENAIDGWVLRLAPRAPKAFDLHVRMQVDGEKTVGTIPASFARLRDPRRFALVGHAVHVERDGVRDYGRLGMGRQSIRETSLYLASEKGWRKYPAIALVFHDPTLEPEATARLAAHMIEPLKNNGIYPVHIAYGSDEMRSFVVRMTDEARATSTRALGSGEALTSYLTRRALAVGRPLLNSWIAGIADAIAPGGGLWIALASLGIEAGEDFGSRRARKIHILSTGVGWAPAASVIAAIDTFGFRAPDSIGRIAPAPGAPQALPDGPRTKTWQLGATPPRDVAMPGYEGDWCDLVCRLSDPAPVGPRGSHAAGAGRDLAQACTDNGVLNATLAHMLGRPPAKSRRFS